MKVIQVKEYQILVDDADFENINKYRWQIQKRRNTIYAERMIYDKNKPNKKRKIKMHRVILNIDDPKIDVDHRDGNGINNQRGNLRIATRQQNINNSKKRSTGKNGTPVTSKYKGVYWDKEKRKWIVRMCKDRKKFYVGRFKNEEDAARAYNVAAVKYFGEFAKLNEVE